jgi:hypothetical protein
MALETDDMGNEDALSRSLAEVSNLLWREREILEHVLFKIIEQQLVLEAGQTRWLTKANAEVEAAALRLRSNEVLRSVEIDALGERIGLDAGATLTQLAAAAPEPWASLLDEHRSALRQLAFELDTGVQHNQLLLGAGARAVRETLLSLSDAVSTYDARGVPASVGAHLSRIDAKA